MPVNVNLEFRRFSGGEWYSVQTAGFATGELLICYVAGLLHSLRSEWRIRVRH